MPTLLVAILGLALLPLLPALFVLFRVTKQYIRQASLHDISGPQRDSLLTGPSQFFLALA